MFVRTSPRAALVVLCLFFAALVANAGRIVDVEPSGALFGRGSKSDFDDYFQAARGLRAGQDVYRVSTLAELRATYSPEDLARPEVVLRIAEELRGVGSYLYPPFLAVLLGPLAGFSYAWAAALFQVLSVLALCAYFVWLSRRRLVDAGDVPALLVIPALICFEFLRGNAANGNIGSFLILLIGVGLVWSFGRSALWAFSGGFLIGIATVLKVTPVFLGLVLVGGRRFTAIGGAVAGGLFGLIAPAFALGWDANLAHHANWYSFIIKNFGEVVFVRPWANNQTIAAAVAKLFLPHADLDQGLAGLPLLAEASDRVIGRLASVVRFLNVLLYTGVALAALRLAWVGRRSGTLPDGPERGGALLSLTSAALLVSLVGSGVSWYHAYCLMLVPIAWRWAECLRTGERPGLADRVLWGSFLLFLVVALLPADVRRVIALYSVFAWLITIAAVLYLRQAWSGSGA